MRNLGEAKPVLRFEGSLVLSNAEAIQRSLLSALREHPTVEVDCSDASEVDISFIQLLIAAQRMAAASGKRLALSNPASGVLCEALQRAGMLESAGDPKMPQDAFWLVGSNHTP